MNLSIQERYSELKEELDNKDPLVRYVKIKEELDNKDPLKRYAQIKEELDYIKEENARKFEEDKKKRDENTLEAMESLFHSLGGEESDVEDQPIIVDEPQELISEEEVENVEKVDIREEQEEEQQEEEQQEEEQPTEEIELSEPDIAEEITTVDQVSEVIAKHEKDKEVKEEVSPIQVKINILEQQIKQLFLDKSILGGGLDPNKISAHLIPTTANTYDLGSSDRPWKDVHLSGATLVIGGTELASSELTVLDNVTAGTISASKAVIVDSNKDINGFRNVNATSYSIGGTAITSTAAEINLLDVSTASGASSSTFLRGDGSWQAPSGSGHTIQNAGSNLTTRAGLNFDGTYVIGTDDSGNDQSDVTLSSALQSWHAKARPSGVVIGTTDSQTLTNKSIDSDNNTITNIVNADIKSSAAIAISKLATVTASRAMVSSGTGAISASAVTATELNLLDGLTSTTAELNILDGVTSTAVELNINDGATLTTAEINLLDISTATGASSSTFLRGDGSWQAVTGESASLAFKTFSISGQSDVVADTTTDTLTFIASGDTTLTTNAGNDTITIDSTVNTVDGGNF
jgi:hypothetical protein